MEVSKTSVSAELIELGLKDMWIDALTSQLYSRMRNISWA